MPVYPKNPDAPKPYSAIEIPELGRFVPFSLLPLAIQDLGRQRLSHMMTHKQFPAGTRLARGRRTEMYWSEEAVRLWLIKSMSPNRIG